MKLSHLLLPATAALVLCLSASAQNAPVKQADGVLANSAGMTVYTFDKDVANSGKSTCYDACAANWPPVAAGNAKLSAPYSSIKRDDGSMQATYKGKPLYLFVKDKKAGDRNGDNVKDVWHIVKD